MNSEDLEFLIEELLESNREVLINRAKQYATDNDRLHNFRTGAALTSNETMRQALGGMMLKHVVSVYDICNSPGPLPSWEHIMEKIGDNINYLLLLYVVLAEEFADECAIADVRQIRTWAPGLR